MSKTLKFYVIQDSYIEYISKFDYHVSWNKEQKRPYIGIVLEIENYSYFAPLYSYKNNYDKYKDNPSFIRIKNRKGNNVAIIRFSEMIPVPKECIQQIDFDIRGNKYRDLLQAEYEYINDKKTIIYGKARKMYKNVTKVKISFFIEISCNFKLLEEKCKVYQKSI